MVNPARIFWKYKLDQVLFWIILTITLAQIRTYLITAAGWGYFIQELVVRNVLLAILVYTVYYFIDRGNAEKKQLSNLYLIAFSLVLTFFYALTKSMHDSYLVGYTLGQDEWKPVTYRFLYNFANGFFLLLFALSLKYTRQWYYQRDYLQKVQIENMKNEINYLKAQMNPHFLFNSLNTLYAQIDEKNTDAKDSLEKISGMLRYQLYECNMESISIEKEIGYIEDYIALQKLRKEENCIINFECSETVKDFFIAPLLIIPFVENALKHLSNFKDRSNIVTVQMNKQDKIFECVISNTYMQQKTSTEGIGLSNVKRRLELLYTNSHELIINKEPDFFRVILKLSMQ
ncbi:MAG TPA: histidine kinase [Panacibacter sp.]|nr:histidine kinase [Panacibacter sp.]